VSLSQLVAFAHEYISQGQLIANYDPPARPPALDLHGDEANYGDVLDEQGPVGDRPPFPDWLREPSGEIIRVGNLGDLIIDEEGGLIAAIASNRLAGKLPSIHEPIVVDALAFYLPYHFYSKERWGIYLRALGAVHLACVLKAGAIGACDQTLLDVAEQLLFEHEFYHCMAEAAATRAEVVVREAIYQPYFYDRWAAPHEEAMANAHAYRQAQRTAPAYSTAIHSWMGKQGVGYRDFAKYVKGRDFTWGRTKCGAYIVRHVAPKRAIFLPLPVEFLFGNVRTKSVPTYLVVDEELARNVLKPFPKFNGMVVKVQSREHPPPHVHIEIPVGNQITKYVWGEPLQPVEGQPALSGKEMKRLMEYLRKFGKAIHDDVSRKYPKQNLRMPAFLASATGVAHW
jgi:hypothetical protein